MDQKIRQLIVGIFSALFFFTPLIVYPQTGEIFEFSKIVFIYLVASSVTTLHIIRIIINKKILFTKSAADIPLILFLVSGVISTYLSLDVRTSLLGYYGRYNGGLFSSISYCLLYWIYLANVDKKDTLKILKILVVSGLIVSIIAVFEHFGVSPTCLIVSAVALPYTNPASYFSSLQSSFDPACWVQNFSERVFSTIGQPNWLAAWMVALIPVTWSFVFNCGSDSLFIKLRNATSLKVVTTLTNLCLIALSITFTLVVIFTKSRSGLIAFLLGLILFLAVLFIIKLQEKYSIKHMRSSIVGVMVILLIAVLLFSHSFLQKTTLSISRNKGETITDTFAIRKIVWEGALNIWRAHPIFGSGVETFGYTYSGYQPVVHNLTSEWNFLFNKAHNEYLNILANTGLVGLVSYITVIGSFFYLFINNIRSTNHPNGIRLLHLGLFVGFITLLITNIVGFSVTVTSLIFFLYPAMSKSLSSNVGIKVAQKNTVGKLQLLFVIPVITLGVFAIYNICMYWQADKLAESAKSYLSRGNAHEARRLITKALNIQPREPYYHMLLAETAADLAINTSSNETDLIENYVSSTVAESTNAVNLSKYNVNLKMRQAYLFISLSGIEPLFMNVASDVLHDAITYAPNDAELLYNYGLTLVRTNQSDLALKTFEKTIVIKPNYKEPRLAAAILYIDQGEILKAQYHLQYIYNNIDQTDVNVNTKIKELE
ncbi:O-antigen ligase family protein [Candidatus Woesebacteria bacterium]|nr:MAG: O-antigen ligase family protein [Candidatus Woesebacteria bacterium]